MKTEKQPYRKPMLRIHFYLRNAKKALPDQKLCVYCQLEIEGQERSVGFSTKYKIPKRYWADTRATDDYFLSDHFNYQLNDFEKAYKHIYAEFQLFRPDETITYEKLREAYANDGVIKRKPKMEADEELKAMPTFLEVYDRLVENKIKKKKITAGTITNYGLRKKNITSYLAEKFTVDLKIDQVYIEHIDGLVAWMWEKGGYSQNYINKHATTFKQVLDMGVKMRAIKHITIGKLDLEYEEPKAPKYLLPHWRERFKECKIRLLEKSRDVGIFLWNTGFSYVDYLSLKSENLVISEDCVGFKKRRGKSKIYSLPMLLPEAQTILKKYGTIENLPRPDIIDFNYDLKLIAESMGIGESEIGFSLSSSVMRETCASMLENEYMLDGRVMMFWMGWINPKQIRNYSNVRPERILHDIKQSGKNKLLLEKGNVKNPYEKRAS